MTNPSTRTTPAPGGPGARSPRPARSGAVELRLAGAALRVVGVLAAPVLGVAWLAAGRDGLVSAGLGVALVAGTYVLSAAFLSYAARFGPGAVLGAALGGYALRLMLYALLLVILRPVEAIHGPSLAISVAVVMIATLVFEVRYAIRTPSLFWLEPAAPRSAAGPERTMV